MSRGDRRDAPGRGRRTAAAEDDPVHHAQLETPAGALRVAYRGATIVVTSLNGDEAGFVRGLIERFGEPPIPDARPPRAVERCVGAAIHGTAPVEAVDLADLTPFQQRALRATAAIPRGEVRTYGEIAAAIGAPGAARAVGSALAGNPVPLIIPCHRVVRADGRLGNYSGPGGPGSKRRLLEWEGAVRPEGAG